MDIRNQPVIHDWYTSPGHGKPFSVIAVDEMNELVEIQHSDGDIEELDFEAWEAMNPETVEAPEDWNGPIDDPDQDDSGYSDGPVWQGSPHNMEEALEHEEKDHHAWSNEWE